MKLITNGRLITRDAEGRGYYEHGAVAYEGAKIAEVGEDEINEVYDLFMEQMMEDEEE